MGLRFEWDREKAKQNLKKHGVSFEDASEVSVMRWQPNVEDTTHSADENRSIIIGQTSKRRILLVVYSARGESLRIISARAASRR
ncbi:MAG: BrnT family toxin [Acidobacteriota bacterium]